MKSWTKWLLGILAYLFIGALISIFITIIQCNLFNGGEYCGLAMFGYALIWAVFGFFILVLKLFGLKISNLNILLAACLGLIIILCSGFIAGSIVQYPPMLGFCKYDTISCPSNYNEAQCAAFELGQKPGIEECVGFCEWRNTCPLDYNEEQCAAFEDGKSQKVQSCIENHRYESVNYSKNQSLILGTIGIILILLSLFLSGDVSIILFIPGAYLTPSLASTISIILTGTSTLVQPVYSILNIILEILIVAFLFFIFIKTKKESKIRRIKK
jgi:hypothetical protein